MKKPVLERTSAAKAGWLVAALTIGWLVFLLLPTPVEEKARRPPAAPLPATSLTRAGLAEYTDWAGLPEIFAVWADRAEWQEGKTRFAYWHPVMKNYSYYFEATRVEGGYRFREISEPHDADYYWDESLGEECPIRFYCSFPVAAPLHIFPSPAYISSDLGPEGIRVDITGSGDPTLVREAIPLDLKTKP